MTRNYGALCPARSVTGWTPGLHGVGLRRPRGKKSVMARLRPPSQSRSLGTLVPVRSRSGRERNTGSDIGKAGASAHRRTDVPSQSGGSRGHPEAAGPNSPKSERGTSSRDSKSAADTASTGSKRANDRAQTPRPPKKASLGDVDDDQRSQPSQAASRGSGLKRSASEEPEREERPSASAGAPTASAGASDSRANWYHGTWHGGDDQQQDDDEYQDQGRAKSFYLYYSRRGDMHEMPKCLWKDPQFHQVLQKDDRGRV